MEGDLMLDVSTAHELKLAFRRNGFNSVDVKWLCHGDLLAKLLPVIRGEAGVVKPKFVIDLDADPVPYGWGYAINHVKGGQVNFGFKMVSCILRGRQNGGVMVCWKELYQELMSEPVFNVNLLEFYLAHPEYIPEEWNNYHVCFWGTIYEDREGKKSVRCLYKQRDNENRENDFWTSCRVDEDTLFTELYPAAVVSGY